MDSQPGLDQTNDTIDPSSNATASPAQTNSPVATNIDTVDTANSTPAVGVPQMPANSSQSTATPPPPPPVSSNTSGLDNTPAAPPVAEMSSNEDYPSNPFISVGRMFGMILQRNTVPALLLPIIFALLVIAGSVITTIAQVDSLFSDDPGASIFAAMLVGMVWVLSIYVGLAILQGAYLAIAVASIKQNSISSREALGMGIKKFWRLVGYILLTGLITCLGLILLVIPGIILGVRLSLGTVAIFEEDLGIIDAMKRSFALTKGHFWETFGVVMAGGIIGSGILAPAAFVSSIAARYKDYKSVEGRSTSHRVHWLNFAAPILLGVLVVLIVATSSFVNMKEHAANEVNKSSTDSLLQQDGLNDDYDYSYPNFNQ